MTAMDIVEYCFPNLPYDAIQALQRLVVECEPFMRGTSDDLDRFLTTLKHYQPQSVNVELEVEEGFRTLTLILVEEVDLPPHIISEEAKLIWQGSRVSGFSYPSVN